MPINGLFLFFLPQLVYRSMLRSLINEKRKIPIREWQMANGNRKFDVFRIVKHHNLGDWQMRGE
jgi:hypothetical protein